MSHSRPVWEAEMLPRAACPLPAILARLPSEVIEKLQPVCTVCQCVADFRKCLVVLGPSDIPLELSCTVTPVPPCLPFGELPPALALPQPPVHPDTTRNPRISVPPAAAAAAAAAHGEASPGQAKVTCGYNFCCYFGSGSGKLRFRR